MKVSVIIPAYNEEDTIEEALEYLFVQVFTLQFRDVEIIVVDNASTDRTAERALGMAAALPLVVLREERQGTMWACERGRTEATGDVIVRMDADCRPDFGWLSRGLAHFEDQNVSAASGPYDYYDAGRMFRWTSLLTQRYVYRPVNAILQWPFIRKGALSIGGNTFMRASALEKAGGFNTSITFHGDDTDTAKRLSHYGRVVFDPRLVMHTSARRFKKEGLIGLQSKYIFHFLKQIVSGT